MMFLQKTNRISHGTMQTGDERTKLINKSTICSPRRTKREKSYLVDTYCQQLEDSHL